MRKVSHFIPTEVVLPERYEIHLRLCGELSELSIREYYPTDTPLELMDNTIKMFQNATNHKHMKTTATRVSDREILLEITGSEPEVISSLDSEINLLRKWAFPLLPQSVGSPPK